MEFLEKGPKRAVNATMAKEAASYAAYTT